MRGGCIALSSLETLRGSLKAGDGDSAGFGASDNDRGFGVVVITFVELEDRGVLLPSSRSSCSAKAEVLVGVEARGAVGMVVSNDMAAALSVELPYTHNFLMSQRYRVTVAYVCREAKKAICTAGKGNIV